MTADEQPPSWQWFAACRDVDVGLFFPARGDTQTVRNAKAVCATCPVIVACREAGVDERCGIWGGLSEAERRRSRHHLTVVAGGAS